MNQFMRAGIHGNRKRDGWIQRHAADLPPSLPRRRPFALSTMQPKVQRMRLKLGLSSHFTFAACRLGGMTELGEAELTDGQGRALSAHRTQQSYVGHAKRTESAWLAATRKRHAHKLANEMATDVQNKAAENRSE
jgi:hypothetical protein